jgi:hypothetical protein
MVETTTTATTIATRIFFIGNLLLVDGTQLKGADFAQSGRARKGSSTSIVLAGSKALSGKRPAPARSLKWRLSCW